MGKPILLLDVDGVLNVIGPDCKKREVRLQLKEDLPISFYPTALAKPLMELAWKRFDVFWMTAWGAGANSIARWAGLEERPVIWGRTGNDWKATAAEKALGSWEGPVAWIEDGISPEAKELVAAKGWTYFHTNGFIGATEAHLKGLEEFADRWTK